MLTNGTDTASANVFTAGMVYTPAGNARVNALQDEDTLTGTGTNPTQPLMQHWATSTVKILVRKRPPSHRN